jgi:TolB protein
MVLRTRASRWTTLALAAALGTCACLAGCGAHSSPAVAVLGRAGIAELGAGQVSARSAVPWPEIGPGWALADYSATTVIGRQPTSVGSTTLYLVDPLGGRYSLFTWPANSPGSQWTLLDWSPDARRALFTKSATRKNPEQQVHQLDLRTGRITDFNLPDNVLNAIGYTRPDATGILTRGQVRHSIVRTQIARDNLQGQRQKVLRTGFTDGLIYSPNGQIMAVGVTQGLELVSSAGPLIRRLPVPGVDADCVPLRWWDTSTVLATCTASELPGTDAQRLWLVPVGGARPAALTPQRPDRDPDQGDFNAWQLSSGLYLEARGAACGSHVIAKQPPRGPVQIIHVPGSGNTVILTATASRLLVQRSPRCGLGSSLAWFNPVTGEETVAVPDRRGAIGVLNVVPYFVQGKR